MQMAADCKKINKGCVNDEKKAISLAVNKIRDKIFVNEMKVIPVQDGCDIEEEKKELHESFSGLEDHCMVAGLNPVNKVKLKKYEKEIKNDCMLAALENKTGRVLEIKNDCMMVAHKREK